MKKITIGQFMSESKGFTSGFDYLRITLALSVLVWHSYLVVYGIDAAFLAAAGFVGYLTRIILPMFFALSGFLVASSLLRNSIPHFLWLRVIRLLPALTVEVVLSAVILGPLVTVLPLGDYFLDSAFHAYFLNLAGSMHYSLPGVFLDNPYNNVVNSSLWTVPFELECYIVLVVISLITLIRRPRLFAGLFVVAVIAKTLLNLKYTPGFNNAANIGGRQLVTFFLAGVIIFLNKQRIPLSGWLALVCGVAGCFLVRHDVYVYLATLPIAYATVYLGLLRPKKLPVIFTGDYSYGIYLYACPIQQSVYHFTEFGKTYLGNVLVATFFVALFAAFSWHAIEKPALKLKNRFKSGKAAAAPRAAPAG